MDVQSFINPVDEAVFDDATTLDEHIIGLFEPASEDSDDEVEFIPKIPISEALEALKKLRLYEEQQEDANRTVIWHSSQQERVILGRKVESSRQQDIRGFFGS